MPKQDKPSMSLSNQTTKKQRLQLVVNQFLSMMQDSPEIPMMFRAILPTCHSLAASSVEKITDEQAEKLIATFKDYVVFLETGEPHGSDSGE